MPKKLRSLALLACATVAPQLQAREFPRPYRSINMLSAGGAGIASVENGEALLHNPSGLAMMQPGLTEISGLGLQLTLSNGMASLYSEKDELSKLSKQPSQLAKSLQGRDLHFGFQEFTGGSFAQHSLAMIADAHLNLDMNESATEFMPGIKADADIYTGFIYGYGMKLPLFGQAFAVGANAKILQKQQQIIDLEGSKILDMTAKNEEFKIEKEVKKYGGSALGTDLAVTFLPRLPLNQRVSLVLRNFGGMGYSGGDSAPSLDKQTLNFGYSLTHTLSLVHTVRGLFDLEDIFDANDNNFYKRLHFGATYMFRNIAGVSLGLNQGYLTYGFNVGYRFISFEMAQYGEEAGTYPGDKKSTRKSFKLKLGWWL